MIILDNNIVSALIKANSKPSVMAWLNHQIPDQIWVTAITVYEARFGLRRMPSGRRQQLLESAFEKLILVLSGRVAPLDVVASEVATTLAARRQAAGLNIEMGDTLMAGIAMSRRAALATRSLKNFPDLDVPVIDPWAFTLV